VLACIPGSEELDLKRLAAAMGRKKADMVHLSEVRPLTGYVRGGVSPVGARKDYPLVLDESALAHDSICVSAGSRGVQMLLAPADLRRATGATVARIARKRTDA
jgi:Cys-tRNA(Pro)/Cys-tRNA(Cys) deacylase